MNEQKPGNCRDAVERLWEYIDGELPASEAENVKRHLAACGSCHPHFDFQKAFCEFLRNADGDYYDSFGDPSLEPGIIPGMLA